jgi:amino acid adenylation domain-containing protein
MSLRALLEDLADKGVELWFEGDRLRFRAPKGALTSEQRARLASERSDVLAHLRAEAASREIGAPLSFSQQSLWFLHAQAPTSTAYHVAMSARIVGPIDTDALRHAVQALVDCHASLRTTYLFVDAAPQQRVAGYARASLELYAVPDADDAALRQAVEADYRRRFDLERGPVFRTSLYSRSAQDHVLLLTVHHIAADGWSLMMMFQELCQHYAEASGGPAAAIARPSLSYIEYAAWQEEMLAGEEGERMWRYWREKLAPPRTSLELPTDRQRPAIPTFQGASLPLQLEPALTQALKTLARAEGVTPFVALLATFQAFLHRLTGAQDVIVGTPTFARSKPEHMSVVGDFVNAVPLRSAIRGTDRFRALIGQLRATVHEALDAQEFPLPLLVRRLAPERDSARSPLFDAFFTLQRFDAFRDLEGLFAGNADDQAIEIGGLRLAPYPLDQQEGQFDLALQMLEHDGVLHGVFKYSTDLFDEATVRDMVADYLALVAAVARDSEIALDDLPAPSARRRRDPGAAALLVRLAALDVRVALDGDKLRVNAPKGALTPELRDQNKEMRDQLIDELAHVRGAGAAQVVRPIPRTGRLPVSSAQQRLWFLERIEPGRADYNIGLALHVRGLLEIPLLQRSLDELCSRHESLRTRIGEHDGAPHVEILPTGPAPLELVDLSHLDGEARADAARDRSIEQARKPFELARGPLMSCLLVRLAPDDHELTITMHHAISDGWSMLTAMREIWKIYAALANDKPHGLPPLAVQTVDYAAWEQALLHSGGLSRHLAYWKAQLAGAPTLLELPTDRPRPAAQSFRGGRLRRFFSPELLDRLKRLARDHDATLYMALLAGWQVLLARYSGQDDIVVGSPMSNRDRLELEGLIGCFVNNVVLRGQLHDDPTFTELLARARTTTLAAFEHRDLPFDVLVDGLQPNRSTSHAPVFQVLFTLHTFPTSFEAPGGLEVKILDRDQGTARFDLVLEVIEYEGKFGALYEYASDLFDADTVARMHDAFERLLTAVVAAPSTPVRAISLLPASDQALLDSWNDTALEHRRERCLHHLLEASAAASPETVAVVDGDTSLTYRALDERANRLAHLLIERGVAPGALVAVCIDRTVDMPVALAAVSKAGAAYVPLDPTHPADRLRYTLEDAGVACAITLSRFAHLVGLPNVPLVRLDEVEAELARAPHGPPEVAADPHAIAYTIYTSGSTGRPKGVEVEHCNVVAFLEAMRREPGCTDDDVLLAVTTLSFDIAGLELWLPLMVGARIVVASKSDVLDGERLIELLAEHEVTLMQATPATWRLMLEAGWSGKPDLKVLCGGEALPRDLAATLSDMVAELWNMYGPTETTIWSTVCRIEPGTQTITIGHPIANTRVYVLEPSGARAPIGVAGELCIGGEGVARGYRNRPELTAEKFTSIELAGGRAERVYRTGDLARFRSDGRLDFLGRRDHQVKVRGYRIELEEIESVLATHPGVKECVVVAREDSPGDQRLVAYAVAETGAEVDTEAARATLRAKLPEYMVPNLLVLLPSLPLTPNGKIDRKALPVPDAPAAQVDGVAEALMTPVQRRVSAVWRDLLRLDRVPLHANFFDVGGHSLLLAKLHAALKREFDTDLTLIELFQWTTVAAQSDRLSTGHGSDAALRRAQARVERQTNG